MRIGLALTSLIVGILFLIAASPVGAVMSGPIPVGQLLHWKTDDLDGFRQAWKRSCSTRHGIDGSWSNAALRQSRLRLCAKTIPDGQDGLRGWLEKNFLALTYDQLVNVTGYYEPALQGSRTRTSKYSAAILGPLDDLRRKLVANTPYFDRAAIENGALTREGLVLAWVDPVDAFFLHIQGSGQIALDGETPVRFGYAADNGHSYRAIGRDLIELGVIQRADMSIKAIRSWLKSNPSEAPAIMQRNKRYIFFRKLKTKGPVGAFGMVLTPRRSVAASPDTQTGLPIWLDAGAGQNGKSPPVQTVGDGARQGRCDPGLTPRLLLG